MKKLSKKGFISLEILALIFVPGAFTFFLLTKVLTLFGMEKCNLFSKYSCKNRI